MSPLYLYGLYSWAGFIESSIDPIIWKYIFVSKNVLFGKYIVFKGFFFFKLAKKLELFPSVLCSLPVMILL